jgi:hypothetical protein
VIEYMMKCSHQAAASPLQLLPAAEAPHSRSCTPAAARPLQQGCRLCWHMPAVMPALACCKVRLPAQTWHQPGRPSVGEAAAQHAHPHPGTEAAAAPPAPCQEHVRLRN